MNFPRPLSGVSAVIALAAAGINGLAGHPAQGQANSSAQPIRLRDVAESAGLHFVYRHSPSPEKHLIESTPGGLAAFDYNNDGRIDIFLTNGADVPALRKSSPAYANRLFRNEGGMRFTDVTDAAGAAGVGYATGAAAADYDNDGDVDLFVTGVRQNQLLRNRGDGRFEDVITTSGIASGDWAVAGGWFDYDNDGRVDLLVVNYVQWSPAQNRYCGDQTKGIRIYCHPRFFQGLPNRLYRNRADGTFEDVSIKSGIAKHVGKGMSVVVGDYNRDGHIDAFVTNDTVPNFLFQNLGDGTFREVGLQAGVSVPLSGRAVSAMGADMQDYDNDGWLDIHLTALTGELFPLFRNDTRGAFEETTQASRLAALSAKHSGWCTTFADIDNDGRKDIFTANSHVNDRIGDVAATTWKQPNSLFVNEGAGRFRDATSESGLAAASAVHRGCGIADFNGDGRLDIVVLALGSKAELWQNDSTGDRRWLIVRLVGTKSNRDGIGARVTVGDQVRTMSTAAGYASSSHAGLHFGLGPSAQPVRVLVEWPSGVKQTVENVKANQTLEVKEQ
jgi:enediyne biosynthesis protein E4